MCVNPGVGNSASSRRVGSFPQISWSSLKPGCVVCIFANIFILSSFGFAVLHDYYLSRISN